MKIESFNPNSIVWENIPVEKKDSESGYSIIRSFEMGKIKIRQVEYSENYLADHWCDKGHIVYIIDGELEIAHQNSLTHSLKKGMSYIVGDDSQPHKANSKKGALI